MLAGFTGSGSGGESVANGRTIFSGEVWGIATVGAILVVAGGGAASLGGVAAGASAAACAACRSRSAFFKASLIRLMAGEWHRAYLIGPPN